MIRKFFLWYRAKFRPSSIYKLSKILLALFSAIGIIYGGIRGTTEIYTYFHNLFFENSTLCNKLSEVNTKISVDRINELFGKPIVRQPFNLHSVRGKKIKWTERAFSHKKFILYVISDEDDVVRAYSITIRVPDLKPSLPLSHIAKMQLGKMTFSDFPDNPEKNQAELSSKYMKYHETYYIGNPGFYKNYQLGYIYPVGYAFPEWEKDPFNVLSTLFKNKDKPADNPTIKLFRTNYRPNVFGVIDNSINEIIQDQLVNDGVMLDYFVLRELP